MQKSAYLKQSAVLSVIAFILLMIAFSVGQFASPGAGQEQFEYIYALEKYVSNLVGAEPALRTVLFFDALFALCYTAAICFAILGFASRNMPVAWFCGLGILSVMGLDYWENITMVQSLDLAAIEGGMTQERVVYLATVSAVKWHTSAAVLFAISFLLPRKTLAELLLVWGTRLGLAIAVPLFVVNAFDMREMASWMILMSMGSGFVLLALVAWQNARETEAAE
ncbi:MAG TPA: hypothetical protein ENK61_08655 [Devosia sp.]|nr:hypothetical protein [Devosia sp.]